MNNNEMLARNIAEMQYRLDQMNREQEADWGKNAYEAVFGDDAPAVDNNGHTVPKRTTKVTIDKPSTEWMDYVTNRISTLDSEVQSLRANMVTLTARVHDHDTKIN